MRCHICGNQNSGFFKASFLPKTFYCLVCGDHLINYSKIPKYKENYYQDKNSDSAISRLTQPVLNFLFKLKTRRIKNILKDKKTPRVLDYGCGSGKLVRDLIRQGFDVVGFEPSFGVRRITKRESLPVVGSPREISGKFDLIMFWHSLEHVKDPSHVIREVKGLLAKGGKLLIAVPNIESWEAKIAKDKWFHFTYPLHRFYFSPRSISYLLNKYSFRVESIDFLNFEYTLSGLMQTFLNLFLPKDVLYSVVAKRRRTIKLKDAVLLSIASLTLIVIFSPLLITFFIIQLFFKKTGAMVVLAK